MIIFKTIIKQEKENEYSLPPNCVSPIMKTSCGQLIIWPWHLCIKSLQLVFLIYQWNFRISRSYFILL